MREMSVRFSIILKHQTCYRTPRCPLPAIREHRVTSRWLHIYAHKKNKKTTHQHDKSHMMAGRSCVFPHLDTFICLLAWRQRNWCIHHRGRPRQGPRGAQSGETAAVASHENEKWRRKNKTKKKGDMNKREGGIMLWKLMEWWLPLAC